MVEHRDAGWGSDAGLGAAAAWREKGIGLVCAFAVIVIFSGFNLVSRIGSTTGLAVWDIAALRFAIAGCLMLPVFIGRGLVDLSIGRAAAIAFLGGLGFALFAYTGFFLAPAAHGAVLLHGTLPLFTVLVGLLLGEAVERRNLPGLVLIAIGIALMAFDTLRGANVRQLLGDGCLLLASLCWSSCGILINRAGISAVQGTAIVVVLSALVYIPIYLLGFGIDGLAQAAVGDVLLQAVVQGGVIGAASIFVYTRAVVSFGPTRTALFTAAVPGVTMLAAIPMLGEDPGPAAWAGVAAVTGGMIAAFAWRRGERPVSAAGPDSGEA